MRSRRAFNDFLSFAGLAEVGVSQPVAAQVGAGNTVPDCTAKRQISASRPKAAHQRILVIHLAARIISSFEARPVAADMG